MRRGPGLHRILINSLISLLNSVASKISPYMQQNVLMLILPASLTSPCRTRGHSTHFSINQSGELFSPSF